jgi:hypothetical protein
MNSQFSERRRGSFSHLLEDHSGPHAGGVKVGLRYHLTSNASARKGVHEFEVDLSQGEKEKYH